MNDLIKFGLPTWLPYNVPQGKNLSEQFNAALKKEHGILVDWYELQRSLREEPALFLRADLRDFPDADGAKLLKAFLESNTKPQWPKTQKRIAVLCCSIEERDRYSSILNNIFCSAVKWELRDE
jgi:hypothetical protein